MESEMNEMNYVVVQEEVGISLGMGDTEEEAWADAADNADSLEGLTVGTVTPALVQQIKDGDPYVWRLPLSASGPDWGTYDETVEKTSSE